MDISVGVPSNSRVLFLSIDPLTISSQFILAACGEQSLTLSEAGQLRDEVSTDEITPLTILAHHDQLGRYPYTGFRVGDQLPIEVDAVINGGFSVSVAGKRYGKGSSREQSPTAELAAGIRLVIAESFERTYRENADNVGLFTSTDYGLLERIACGEAITVDELVAGREPQAAAILRSGGLLKCRRHLRHVPRNEGDVKTGLFAEDNFPANRVR